MKFILGLLKPVIKGQEIDPYTDEPALKILFFMFATLVVGLFITSMIIKGIALGRFKEKIKEDGYIVNGENIIKDGVSWRIQEQADSWFFAHKFELKEAK